MDLKMTSLQLFAQGGGGTGAPQAEAAPRAEAAPGAEAASGEAAASQAEAAPGTEQSPDPREAAARRQYALWARQAQEARELYPDLDMNVEARNPRFRQLLRAGVDVGSAYFTVHQNDILPAAMRHTARVVEQRLVDKFLAGAARPQENGVSAQAPAVTRTDVRQLTKDQRKEIRRRAAMGEKIRF